MSQTPHTPIKIGGACGFWGDSSLGTEQLLGVPGLNYITYDYLAELTMAIMAGMRMKNPEHGYALDFIELMKQALPVAKNKGIRIIANAGGLNPAACATALKQAMQATGLDVHIGVVSGDDATATLAQLRADGTELNDAQSGQAAPPFLLTANAYLGAFPIAAALNAGADIVITGRVVDSAMVLGALIHEYNWTPNDLDQLAQGSLAGHIVECGAQATGGLFTDWESVPDWANIGYPVVEVQADGTFELCKPEGTGGLINKAVTTEQLLYEIHDPARYALPDVVCDFSQVHIEETGPNRVRIHNAKGRAPSGQYKVCATYPDGFRCIGLLSIAGFQARAKAQRTGEAILARCRMMLSKAGLSDFSNTHMEVIGSDEGLHAEAVVRVAITHRDKKGATLFSREIAPAGTSYAPGTSGNFGMGRPNVSPLVKLFTCFVDKALQAPKVMLNDTVVPYQEPEHPNHATDSNPTYSSETLSTRDNALPIPPALQGKPLLHIAHGRSGDKGNTSNVGIVARDPAHTELIQQLLSPETIKEHLSQWVKGEVRVHALPTLNAFNVVMDEALDGGGMRSMRNDPLGKGMAQLLLHLPIQG